MGAVAGDIVIIIILTFLGSLCPAIIYNVSPKRAFWAGVSGVVGRLVFNGLMSSGKEQIILATFMGALAVGVYSETLARILKSPATVFSVPGIFPLVPGIGAYMTVRHVTDMQMEQASLTAVETIASAGSIALGIMLASALFRMGKQVLRKTVHSR